MSDTTTVLTKLETIFTATETILKENGKMKFPALLTQLAVKLDLNEDQTHLIDPVVRYFVNNSDTWVLSRGAKGGVELRANKLNKAAKKARTHEFKVQLKSQIEQELEAQEKVDDDFEVYNDE